MNLLHKTYVDACQRGSHECVARIERLLLQEGVKYITRGSRVMSTRVPIIVLGFQRQLYTQKNWVGVNPFVCVTGVDIACESIEGGRTRVTIEINRRRAILAVAFWAACGALMGHAMPQPAGIVVFGLMVISAWFGIVEFLGGRLLKREIMNELGARPRGPL
jgi:hypothetical protein